MLRLLFLGKRGGQALCCISGKKGGPCAPPGYAPANHLFPMNCIAVVNLLWREIVVVFFTQCIELHLQAENLSGSIILLSTLGPLTPMRSAKLSFDWKRVIINQTGSLSSNQTWANESTDSYSCNSHWNLSLALMQSNGVIALLSTSARKIDRTKPKLWLRVLGRRYLEALYVMTCYHSSEVFLLSSVSASLVRWWMYTCGSPFFAER